VNQQQQLKLDEDYIKR